MTDGSLASADLGWLEPGTHLCAFPHDERQLTRIAATFVDQGLSAGDQLLYVASEEQADAMLAMLPAHVRGHDALAAINRRAQRYIAGQERLTLGMEILIEKHVFSPGRGVLAAPAP